MHTLPPENLSGDRQPPTSGPAGASVGRSDGDSKDVAAAQIGPSGSHQGGKAGSDNTGNDDSHGADHKQDALPSQDVDANGDAVIYPSNTKAFLIIAALCLSVFIYALDQTIIATAIPTIASEFQSAGDIGWYGSAYLLTSCAFQLAYGQLYRLFAVKFVYVSALLIFELGSLVCGVAPSSTAFIIGRALAGLGCAGIFSGAFVILQFTVPLQKRAAFAGVFGATFALASIAGPLIGGAFTRSVTWRWCFYINLPIGAVVVAIATFLFKEPQGPSQTREQTFWARVKQIDWLGLLCFLPSIICLLLALQLSGEGGWYDGRVIATLVVFAVLLVAFVASQIWQGERAMVPTRILLKHRSIPLGALYTFSLSSAFLMVSYYLPLWYQFVLGVSPIQSGVNTLGVILGFAVASILAGAAVSTFGYFVPPMLVASILASIGAGLMSTFTPSTNSAHWIGYTVLLGLGIGAGIQQPEVAVQALLDKSEVSIGFALMAFAQSFGGAIFVSVGQNVFGQKVAGSGLRPQSGDTSVLSTNRDAILDSVAPDQRDAVLGAYSYAIAYTFLVAAIMAAISFFSAIGMEWASVKAQQQGPQAAEANAEAKQGKEEKAEAGDKSRTESADKTVVAEEDQGEHSK